MTKHNGKLTLSFFAKLALVNKDHPSGRFTLSGMMGLKLFDGG